MNINAPKGRFCWAQFDHKNFPEGLQNNKNKIRKAFAMDVSDKLLNC